MSKKRPTRRGISKGPVSPLFKDLSHSKKGVTALKNEFDKTRSPVELLIKEGKGKQKTNPSRLVSYYDFDPMSFDHSKLDKKTGLVRPQELGYKLISKPAPFLESFYNSTGHKMTPKGFPVNDRIFKGIPGRFAELMKDLVSIRKDLVEDSKDFSSSSRKSSLFSLKEISSIIYLPGVEPSHHQGMLDSVEDKGFKAPRHKDLEDFLLSHVDKAIKKEKHIPVSIKRHTNTGGLLPTSGMDVHRNSLALAIQTNIASSRKISQILKFEDILNSKFKREGVAQTGLMRLPGFRFQHNASPRPLTEYTSSGFNIKKWVFAEPKKRVIYFGGKETEIAAKPFINKLLYGLKGTPFVSTDPEKTRVEQKKILTAHAKAMVVSIDFTAFDSTAGGQIQKMVMEMFSSLVSKDEMKIWELEASLPAMAPKVHDAPSEIFVAPDGNTQLRSGRFDTSVMGLAIGTYLGLYAILEAQYSFNMEAFIQGMNKEWHVADYGDDLQITSLVSFAQLDKVTSKWGFKIEEEPTTSHLKKVIDHDRNVVHNSFFSMFKNAVGPERPKFDKMTFALGIAARMDLANLDPLLTMPKVQDLISKLLNWQGDFESLDHLMSYTVSNDFKEDMTAYVKGSVSRAKKFADILAAATQGSMLYDDLSVRMQDILGLQDLDSLVPSIKADDIPRLKEKELEEVFSLLAEDIYFSNNNKDLPLTLLEKYFHYDKNSFEFAQN